MIKIFDVARDLHEIPKSHVIGLRPLTPFKTDVVLTGDGVVTLEGDIEEVRGILEEQGVSFVMEWKRED